MNDINKNQFFNMKGNFSNNDNDSKNLFEKESKVICEHLTKNKKKIQLRKGDLTKEKSDVIVSAANNYLSNSGGLGAAIIRNGGDSIEKECDKYVQKKGPLKDSSLFASSSGKLDCKAIYHSVPPSWAGGKKNEEKMLSKTIKKCLKTATKDKYTSISFPALSTGNYNFPKDKCSDVFF